ncbi:hypothetical protein M408DRAFT_231668 [Serendipita vermifera MAFF 305830]|uniref:Uncharacterized protein n=1 Tax=Serendipita vermifera MAFF 305830 TaxID=933852 RepID=A0A0C3AJ45_SERVB|nr:hypothetical protein M408DRAFT_231668 [Serendipita vermifera MAFF 305830]
MEKTPVEIWTTILSHLLHTPLLPHQDATFAQDIAIFAEGCDSDKLERESTQVACLLRLVCHSWNSIVRRIQIKCVRCNINPGNKTYAPTHVLPSLLNYGETRSELLMAQRLEIWIPRRCYCDRKCRSAVLDQDFQRMLDSQDTTRDFNSESVLHATHDLPKLEVFIPWLPLVKVSPNLFLDRLPNLKVSYWAYLWTRLYFNDIIHHRSHQNLTHLNIELTWDNIRSVDRPVIFRVLRFLRIYITQSSSSIIPKVHESHDLATWAQFPRLQRLCLALDDIEGRLEEITLFLKAIGVNLAGLILEFPWDSTDWLMPDFWSHFPSLLEVGSGYQMIPPIPPPPITMTPPSLVYPLGSHTDVYIPSDEVVTSFSPTPIDQFLQECNSWRIERLTVVESWQEAEEIVASLDFYREHNKAHACLSTELYERVQDLGIDIRDRDETRITEPAGKRFLEALGALKTRSSRWYSSIDDSLAVAQYSPR